MKRDVADVETQAAAAPPARVANHTTDTAGHFALAHRRVESGSLEEAEARYAAARDTWVKAMHAANSGRPADLASLALAQEAYETAVAERERWLSGRIGIPIETPAPRPNLDVIVGNELQWRRIHAPPEKPKGLLGRFRRRVGR